MNATTTHRYNGNPATDPRQYTDLYARAQEIIDRIRLLQEQSLDAYTNELYRLRQPKYACDINREIQEQQVELDLLMAEVRRRRTI